MPAERKNSVRTTGPHGRASAALIQLDVLSRLSPVCLAQALVQPPHVQNYMLIVFTLSQRIVCAGCYIAEAWPFKLHCNADWRAAGHVMINRVDNRSMMKCLGQCKDLLSQVSKLATCVQPPAKGFWHACMLTCLDLAAKRAT